MKKAVQGNAALKRFSCLLFLYPALVYGAEVTNPEPCPSVEYKKERICETTVHRAYIKLEHELELVIAKNKKQQLTTMIENLESSEHKNVLVGINGGYFGPATGNVIGTLIYRGKHLEKLDFGRAEMGIKNNAIYFGYYGEAYPPEFFYLLTAGPYLVKEGRNIARHAAEEEDFSSDMLACHPRTAVGKKADGSLVLIVAEGRRKDERGLKLEELAGILIKDSCVEAINFDGGGSSTLVLSGEFYGKEKNVNLVQNQPSDGRERAIANGFVIIENLIENHK